MEHEIDSLNTLPHLTNEIVRSAKKTKLDAFAVALEGWRRGLTLKWYTKDSEHFQDMIVFGVNPPGRLFSLSSEERTHYFFRTRGDKVTNEAVIIGSDKDTTKEYLINNGVPSPIGKMFTTESSVDEIVEIVEQTKGLKYPLVVKPVDGSLGMGVVTNIKNQDALRRAIEYVREDLEYEEIIVEKHITGKEYRVYVVGDKPIAAYNRVPANIIGDGEHTIEELIHRKNNERRKNARLHDCLIEIDREILEHIEEAGHKMSDIPERGELIYLRDKSNISIGGDPIDVLDTIAPEILEVAIKALNSIPGLYHGGVDIIYDEKTGIPPVVIELNPTAQIGGPLFPIKGTPRDIPKAIIDYYFPETINNERADSKVYFDLNTVLEPLTDRTGVEVEVNPAPIGKIHTKKFILQGRVKRNSFHHWIKEKALDLGLHGYVQKSIDNKIEVVIAGTSKENISEFRRFLDNPPKNVNIRKITSEKYEEPIKIGFEIEEGYNPRSFRSMNSAIYKMERELHKGNKRKIKLEKEIKKIKNSTSWKKTKPLRRVSRTIKKIVKAT